jgi:hypothetical protein
VLNIFKKPFGAFNFNGMKMKFVTLIAAVLLAGSAAIFSVIGLTKIFVGVLVPFLILEFGKFIAALHLHNNWKTISKPIKFYLTSAVAILMIMTSMGIFGYLANSAMVHTTSTQKEQQQVSYIESQISSLTNRRSELSKEKEQLNTIVNSFTSSKDESATLRGNTVYTKQKAQRNSIDEQLKQIDKSVFELQATLNEKKNQYRNIQVEIGPAIYMASAFYGDSSLASIEGAIRIVIYLIIFTFDPLAVVLLIVATESFRKETVQEPIKKVLKVKRKEPIVEGPTIDDIVTSVDTLKNKSSINDVSVVKSIDMTEFHGDPYPEEVVDQIGNVDRARRFKAALERKDKQKKAIEKKIESLS